MFRKSVRDTFLYARKHMMKRNDKSVAILEAYQEEIIALSYDSIEIKKDTKDPSLKKVHVVYHNADNLSIISEYHIYHGMVTYDHSLLVTDIEAIGTQRTVIKTVELLFGLVLAIMVFHKI